MKIHGALLAAAITAIIAAPATAAEPRKSRGPAWECVSLTLLWPCPPPDTCRVEPPAGSYVVNHVRDPDNECRVWRAKWGRKTSPFGRVMGCAFGGQGPGRDQWILFLPDPSTVSAIYYAAVRAHELGHVNCHDTAPK